MFQNLCNNEVATELKLGEKTGDKIPSTTGLGTAEKAALSVTLQH
jgi:hypothetical protein